MLQLSHEFRGLFVIVALLMIHRPALAQSDLPRLLAVKSFTFPYPKSCTNDKLEPYLFLTNASLAYNSPDLTVHLFLFL